MSTPSIAADEQQRIRAASDALLRIVFPDDTLVWISSEEYDMNGPVWRVTLVYPGAQSHWMRRRYRYDIPSNTLHFAGEQPVNSAELRTARANGRRLRQGS
jgi:hypothetical protein